MKRILAFALSLCFFSLFPLAAYSQSPSPSPSPVAVAPASAVSDAVAQLQASPIIDFGTFVKDASLTFSSMGALSGAMKIVCGIMLLLALAKVSADGKVPLLSSIWPQSDALKAWMAPILGLALGILMLGANGAITMAGVLTYASVGSGAIALHEILDTVKALPGLGAGYVAVINVIEGVLGGNPPAAKSSSSSLPKV